MASLDVTLPLSNPLLVDKFNVIRRMETVSSYGRLQVTEQTLPGFGVVTAGGNNALDRGTDYDVTARAINVVTKLKLFGESEGNKADIIIWKGSQYLVKVVEPYGHFGSGFYQAECESQDQLDGSSIAIGATQLIFKYPQNSGYLSIGF